VGQTLQIPEPGEVTGAKYKVRPGDSVASIADFHGVSQDDLRAANRLKKNDNIRPGQELSIPHDLRGGTGRGHVVRQGDTLAAIAKQHGVSVKSLAAANKLTRKSRLELGRTLVIPDDDDNESETLRPKKVSKLVKTGKKVPGGVRHTVQPGQSLWIIARAYNTTGDRICAANGIEKSTPLKTGDTILIPGAKEVVPVRTKGFSIQPVRFVSVWNNKSANLKLISRSGKINPRSRRLLSRLAGPKQKTKKIKLLHPRLIHMLQRVAERYPGHTIEIISGYRQRKPGGRLSKHNLGKAIDFRVQGIDRKELYNYIKQLPRVGAGYYPNSVFVHMDVRDESAVWTDFSGIGEDAKYKPDEIDPEALADAEE
jgi:LysM repeat protein